MISALALGVGLGMKVWTWSSWVWTRVLITSRGNMDAHVMTPAIPPQRRTRAASVAVFGVSTMSGVELKCFDASRRVPSS